MAYYTFFEEEEEEEGIFGTMVKKLLTPLRQEEKLNVLISAFARIDALAKVKNCETYNRYGKYMSLDQMVGEADNS